MIKDIGYALYMIDGLMKVDEEDLKEYKNEGRDKSLIYAYLQGRQNGYEQSLDMLNNSCPEITFKDFLLMKLKSWFKRGV